MAQYGVPPAAMASAAALTKAFIEQSRETRTQPLYDSFETLGGVSIAISTTLFQTPQTTPLFGNMLVGGQLPAPRQFLVDGCSFQVAGATPAGTPLTSPTTGDYLQYIYRSLCIWSISDKEYLRIPAVAAPFPGGAYGGFHAELLGAGTFAGNQAVAGNGWPVGSSMFRLKMPGQLIRPQENFSLTVLEDAAWTVTNRSRVYWYFWGLELRAVQ